MEGPGEADPGDAATRPRRGLALLLIAGSVALSVLVVLVIGSAFANRLEDDDEPATVTVTQPEPVSTTTEPPSEVVLAPPVSVDNTTTTAAPGG